MSDMNSSINEEKSEIGLVSRCLPWHWSRTPQTLQSVMMVAADVFTRLKESHPVCASALGTAEDGARRASYITMGLADKAAKVVDKRLDGLIADSRKGLSGMEKYAIKKWSHISDLGLSTVASVEKSTGYQFGLQFADSVLSFMDRWTQNYQEYLRNTRRWIRHSRRRGSGKQSNRRIRSPRKRVKMVHRLWNLATRYIPGFFSENDRKRKVDAIGSDSDTSDSDEDNYSSNSNASEDKTLKTRLEEIQSESESSNADPEYSSEASSSTDSLEYNSGEEGEPEAVVENYEDSPEDNTGEERV